jgi:hypothetical protein
MTLETFVRIGGGLQIAILSAGALVPFVLDWRRILKPLPQLMRHLFWVYGAYIMLMITALGLVSLTLADVLVDGALFSRVVAGFIAVFWTVRLAIQFFLFDARPYLNSVWLKLGYHGLTCTFVYLSTVFTLAALR